MTPTMTTISPSMPIFPAGRFHPFAPRPEEIAIETIAHALSQICRWGGHTREFFSVAQHSVLVSKYCPPEDALWGLLHDAAEAYCGDVIRPLRLAWPYDGHRGVEQGIQEAVCQAFRLPLVQPASVGAADEAVATLEQRDLLPLEEGWAVPVELSGAPTIVPWAAEWAQAVFLERYRALDGARGDDARR